MSRLAEDDSLEPFERYSLEIEPSATEDDQEQGLLENFAEDPEDATSAQATPKRHWRLFWWPVTFAVTIACLAGASWYLIYNWQRGEPESKLPIQTNNYILDPNWDYHAPPQRR